MNDGPPAARPPEAGFSAPEGFRAGFACVVGRPNTGKSTLTNAMVGRKVAIASARPETTRRVIRAVVNREDGQVVIVDTPGLHRPRTLLGERLNEMVRDSLAGVDVVVVSVASQGVPKVTEMALPGIAKAKALWLTSKGFMPVDGKILLLPEGIRSIAKAADVELPPIVAIAGPVKANECAAGEPTATIFGCKSRDVAVEFARAARSAIPRRLSAPPWHALLVSPPSREALTCVRWASPSSAHSS